MTTSISRTGEGDLVPLAERMRYLLGFRAIATFVVVGYVFAVPPADGFDPARVAVIAGVYLLLSGAGHLAWRAVGSRALVLLGAALLLDGLFIASAAYLTGGVASPLRHLAIVHLAMVALLASYRTGLKLALWHSVLLSVGYRLQQDGFLAGTTGVAGVSPEREGLHLVGYVAAFWLVAIVTATFSSVNERELRRRQYDLEALAKLSSELEAAHNPREVGEQLVKAVVDVVDAPRALLLADRADGSVRLLASVGVEPTNSPLRTTLASVLSQCHSTRVPVLSAGVDAAGDPWLSEVLPEAGNLIVLPMTVDARPVGTLVVEHGSAPGSRVERRVVSILERFASQAALALRGAWLMETVQAQASLDGLTGVANRRSFDVTLDLEIQRAARGAAPMSLVLFDLDHFKLLNDSHGHQAGDQVLREVAAVLRQHSRDIDTVARYGGEEFALILPQCSEGAALQTAERLLMELSIAPTAVPVTASAGVATWGPNLREGSALLAAADVALYRSKHGGRNRATAATTSATARVDAEVERSA
ncbi:MAG TPA: GGDEF domain-containing protein [Mycobacteriales bacterium]|nr:GGDEF domain-containing protein [Mycobacteriales bacterium]